MQAEVDLSEETASASLIPDDRDGRARGPVAVSSLRRSLGSFLVLAFLVILLAENLPTSHIKDQLSSVLPVSNATGLRQEWGVFSPNPARLEANTSARVVFTDGSEFEWTPPAGSGRLESNSTARWQKWSDRIRLDNHSVDWPATAALIAADVENRLDRPVEQVELVREWSEGPLPGDGFDREWMRFVFYRLNVITGEGRVLGLDDPVNAEASPDPVEVQEPPATPDEGGGE